MFATVIVPTFNKKEKLKRCIKSLLNQSYKNYEIIIVDDGSTDNTSELFLSFRNPNLRYFKQEHKGPATARNKGIQLARGNIIGFTDDDCIADKNWIKNAIKYFKDPEVIGVEGRTFFDKKPFLEKNKKYVGFLTCNIFYKKSLLKRVKKFDKNFIYPFREDTDLAWRALRYGKIVRAEDVIVYHPEYKGKKKWKAYSSDIYLYSKFPKLYMEFVKEGGVTFVKNPLTWLGLFYGMIKYKKTYPFLKVLIYNFWRKWKFGL